MYSANDKNLPCDDYIWWKYFVKILTRNQSECQFEKSALAEMENGLLKY